jgi:NAD+ synthase
MISSQKSEVGGTRHIYRGWDRNSESNALKLTSGLLRVEPVETEKRITAFIRDYVRTQGAPGVVLGISGGIDSAVSAAVSAKAVGPSRVLGLSMPEVETWDAEDIKDAELVAKTFGITLERIDISPLVRAAFDRISVFDSGDRLANGNVKARMRMVVLYYYANRTRHLVVGSSDKSEFMLGYFTKWGDYCADLSPLTDLYKSQVRQLALHLGVPAKIVEKRSTPNLWPGQTAEEELGLNYDQLDLVLFGLEHSMAAEEIVRELRLSADVVKRVEVRCRASEHKRKPPVTVKLG